MSNVWILVAESSRAKLYATPARSEPIAEVESFAHPEGRLPERDLVSDNAGFDGGSVGQSHHVMQKKVSARDEEAERFAKRLTDHLEAGRLQGEFDKMVLMAPPGFLGHLRNNLNKDLKAMVVSEVDKNLVMQPGEVVQQYL